QGTHGNVVAVRLTFDLDGDNGPTNQARVWFDDVSIRTWGDDGETSRLDHKWVFPNLASGGTVYRLKLQAYHSSNLEGDDFDVYYSLDDQVYHRVVTVTNTLDEDTYYAYILPSSVGGNSVYIKVLDLSWTNGTTELDTLHVDHLVIERITIITPSSFSYNLGDNVYSIAVGDIDGDGDIDIAAGLESNEVAILRNGGTGTSWSRNDIASSGDVLSVGLGDFDGDGDTDVAAGTGNEVLYVYINSNGAGTSWSSITLEQDIGDVLTLATGDVNGDGWVDIVIGTDEGNVYYYENGGSSGWERIEIDSLSRRGGSGRDINELALGDVDRGILP
ncbi:MAG: hypothetical protein GTO63_13965, partial [Anaerolineae bacterium]|nr:hypothetical protein [Anaerolineae bacterium]